MNVKLSFSSAGGFWGHHSDHQEQTNHLKEQKKSTEAHRALSARGKYPPDLQHTEEGPLMKNPQVTIHV